MPSDADVVKHVDFDVADAQIIATRPKRAIEIVEPNPKWAASFTLIAQRIQAALGSRALVIEHVGSTSIPNLPAKDIIDVDLVVADPTDEESYVQDLEDAGFQFLIREPKWYEHRFFGLDEPYANIHVFGPGAAELTRHRIFKQWLLNHEDDLVRYAEMKRAVAAESRVSNETMDQYCVRKNPIVRDILDRAFREQGLLK
jgi:GrpB-like predicted nucleotidyltransferase (UPF0157 family)